MTFEHLRSRSICFLWRNLIVFALLALWLVVGWVELSNETFIPDLPKVVVNTVGLLGSYEFWGHILSSLSIILSGFLLSAVVAIPIGILMGMNLNTNLVLQNFIELIRPISPLALYPLFIFLFGLGFISKLAIVFWVTWIPLLFNTITGVQNVNDNYLRMAKILKASKTQLLREIIIPAVTPWVITGMRLAMGSALLVIVAAEMIGSNKGIGFFILNASYTFNIVDLYSGIVIIAIIGIMINWIFLFWEKNSVFKR